MFICCCRSPAAFGVSRGAVPQGQEFHKLLTEYQSLRKRYWGQHLWSRGYWVATSGNVTDEVWKKYIEDQKVEEPDDYLKEYDPHESPHFQMVP